MWVHRGGTVWAEVGPERCLALVDGVACGDERMLPRWGPCPEPTCSQMCRLWACASRDHVVADVEHEHREWPAERPRWHCGHTPLG